MNMMCSLWNKKGTARKPIEASREVRGKLIANRVNRVVTHKHDMFLLFQGETLRRNCKEKLSKKK